MIILINKSKVINQSKLEIKNVCKFTKLNIIKLANPEVTHKSGKYLNRESNL